MLIAGVAAASLAAAALYWAFIRISRVVFPTSMTAAVESEEFRTWLGGRDDWSVWGRDMEGRYYLTVVGAVAARRMRREALRQIAAQASPRE